MNETLQTLAAYTADRRAEAAAAIRDRGGEKELFPETSAAIKKLLGADHAKLKKYLPDGSEYGKKYRSNIFRYWNKSAELDKVKMISLEAPALKVISTYGECELLTIDEKKLVARSIAYDLYRELGHANQTITNDKPQKKNKANDVLLNTLWAEVERQKAQGYDFEQIAGMLQAITKGRLTVGASKIANEYYTRHPDHKKKAASH